MEQVDNGSVAAPESALTARSIYDLASDCIEVRPMTREEREQYKREFHNTPQDYYTGGGYERDA